jgi:hypothetical protein
MLLLRLLLQTPLLFWQAVFLPSLASVDLLKGLQDMKHPGTVRKCKSEIRVKYKNTRLDGGAEGLGLWNIIKAHIRVSDHVILGCKRPKLMSV